MENAFITHLSSFLRFFFILLVYIFKLLTCALYISTNQCYRWRRAKTPPYRLHCGAVLADYGGKPPLYISHSAAIADI